MGGFGIVPADVDGAIVSSHYFLFAVDETALDRHYLDFYVRTSAFREQVSARGSTNYAAIRPADVLGYTMPLPPLTEQQRIVARLGELAAKIEEARGLRREAMAEMRALEDRTASRVLNSEGHGRLGDFACVQSGYAFKSEWFSDVGVRLVRNVNVGHGRIDWGEAVRLPEWRRGQFERFELRDGDILVSLDRPVISTGVKVARVASEDLPSLLLQRVGRFQLTSDELAPGYLFEWLRSPLFLSAIDPGRSNGVPHISPKEVERIPFTPPPLSEQYRVIAQLEGLRATAGALERLQQETAAELEAMLPAVLERAFRGEL